jgi:alginate O-acetyltransferase complex protein AlgJ
MFNISSLRYRYTQFFVLFVLCSFIYVMVQSMVSGITTFQDNFYKKDFLIGKAALLRIKIGDRVFSQVLLGKDGWMEYTNGSNIDDFQNITTFGNKQKLVKELKTLNKYLKSQGITLLIVVAPNKASIYPDKLPEQIKSLPTQSRLDKLITYLEDNNLPVMVDLRPALRDARQDQDVYYKTNTHWNGYGAFTAYTTIINSLGSSYPELKPYETTDLELVTSNPGVQEIPRMLRVDFITEPYIFFKPEKAFVHTIYPGDTYGYNQFSSIPDSELPTLLMFHDSFGSVYLNNYLSMNFGKSHFIHLRGMSKYLTKESIQQFKPDVIIIEVVERGSWNLVNLLSNFASK